MGVAIYVVLERELTEAEPLIIHMSGKALAGAMDDLEALAEELGVPSLLSFFGASSEEYEELLDDMVGAPDLAPPPEPWFSAAEGLRTVRALLARLRAPEEEFVDALTDLEDMERILAIAEREQVRFHVAMDI